MKAWQVKHNIVTEKVIKTWLIKTCKSITNDIDLLNKATNLNNTPFEDMDKDIIKSIYDHMSWMIQSQYNEKWGNAYNLLSTILMEAMVK